MKKIIQLVVLALFLPMALMAPKKTYRRQRRKQSEQIKQLALGLKGLTAAMIAGRVEGRDNPQATTRKKEQAEKENKKMASKLSTERPTRRVRAPKKLKKFKFGAKAPEAAAPRSSATADFSRQLADAQQGQNKVKMRALYPFEGSAGIPGAHFDENLENQDWSNIDFDDDKKTVQAQARRPNPEIKKRQKEFNEAQAYLASL